MRICLATSVTRAQVTVEERIAAASRRKTAANQLSKEEELTEAIQQYEMVLLYHALAYLGDYFLFQLEGEYKEMADAVKIPCHLNMGACFQNVERFYDSPLPVHLLLQRTTVWC